ncbi:DUF2721 domain-containing protein [Hankyongella ginsenosidimutans]|uniref:DUF2721 domain-containing protein n=1 Tax=Hankyongella ginsenosidimutans TaxID=1763828 RepID=A0A4D7C4Y8_9SPHN|nr:DUF2721 domain-containing protein [Hankyongella ginsenosidimutans]QCI78610.1 DUF2721 domain-containing protein [Hankyongella ginsenosidimutans]TXG84640.1 MAG: DUF2721 domain-containing protein [Sphingomonadales bacterium]
MTANPVDLAHIIQLAIAPVFLLAGIGSMLNVMSVRLGRVIDRARILEERAVVYHGHLPEDLRLELQVLSRRMTLAHSAISLGTASALFVCVLVALLFLSGLTGSNLGRLVAVAFILAMSLLALGLTLFLIEMYIATRSVRVRRDLLMEAHATRTDDPAPPPTGRD